MTYFIAPTDVTKGQSDNNSAVEVENNENYSQQQITHYYSTATGAVFGMCNIYD